MKNFRPEQDSTHDHDLCDCTSICTSALHQYHRGHVFKSCSGFSFTTAQIVCDATIDHKFIMNAMINQQMLKGLRQSENRLDKETIFFFLRAGGGIRKFPQKYPACSKTTVQGQPWGKNQANAFYYPGPLFEFPNNSCTSYLPRQKKNAKLQDNSDLQIRVQVQD